MTDNQFELIRQYDQLEALLADGEAPSTPPEHLAGELAVARLLMHDAETISAMPRAEAFRADLRKELTPPTRRGWWGGTGLVLAAAVLAAIILFPEKPEQGSDIILDDQLLAMVEREDVRTSMLDYLDEAEHLLQAIRDYETTCSKDQADLALERQLANTLLLRQKQFSTEMNKPQYYQARQLFSQLEAILVDLNGLEPCTDVYELDFLNEHISKNRILSKVRIVAQGIELS
jgi:hypothetical protein